MVARKGKPQLGAKKRGKALDFIAINEYRTAAEDRFHHAAAGAPGKIAHNQDLKRRVRLESRVSPFLARFDIENYACIILFWHL